MRIEKSEKDTELSYLDLLKGLQEDVNSDAIPAKEKAEVDEYIRKLYERLEKYSA